MFIVEINSNQFMNAGQIPMNCRDHVGVALDRGPWHSDRSLKWQVNSLSRENTLAKTFQSTPWFTNSCSFKVHKTFPRITVNKLPRLPPASISYSPAISLFLWKNLGEKRLYMPMADRMYSTATSRTGCSQYYRLSYTRLFPFTGCSMAVFVNTVQRSYIMARRPAVFNSVAPKYWRVVS